MILQSTLSNTLETHFSPTGSLVKFKLIANPGLKSSGDPLCNVNVSGRLARIEPSERYGGRTSWVDVANRHLEKRAGFQLVSHPALSS